MKPSDDKSGDSAAIEMEALDWLAERDDGFAPGRAAAFDAWRRRDPRHAASVEELEHVMAQLDGLAERRTEVNAHFNRVSPAQPVPVHAPSRKLHPWPAFAWMADAAMLAFAFFFGARGHWRAGAPETRYATTAAGYERVRLDDGSTLELNTSSAAHVRFSADERRVELEAGEAHFEVAHNAARPFVVSAAGVRVCAVGTAFNVRFVSGAIEVIVTEGKVSVGPPLAAKPVAGEPSNRSDLLVAVNHRLVVPLVAGTSPTPTADLLARDQLRAALAWQRRVTDFSDTPLAEVAARFNRHNAIQLVIADRALEARRIGGMFALDDVEAFVRLLERDGVVVAERNGETLQLRAP